MRLVIWHNVVWSLYKANVFAALGHKLAAQAKHLFVYQIDETDRQRADLSPVQRALHLYPHDVVFQADAKAGTLSRVVRILRRTAGDPADVTLLAGIERPAYWVQAAYLMLRRRRRGVFYDSTAFDREQNWLTRLAKRAFFAMVPFTLSYGARARSFAIANGVRPDRALLRCQAAFLPPGYAAHNIPAARCAAAAPPDRPLFLYAGRLAAEKDLDTLLRAFADIARSMPLARLRLVGAGPQRDALAARAEELPGGERIEFAGPSDGAALYRHYLEATALVLPSRSEPWGLVVNEALHHGCPVIVSDRCGCVPELVQYSDCGIVFACGDHHALADAMWRTVQMARDPDATARRCLAKIAPYTSDAAAEQILAAVDTILRAPA